MSSLPSVSPLDGTEEENSFDSELMDDLLGLVSSASDEEESEGQAQVVTVHSKRDVPDKRDVDKRDVDKRDVDKRDVDRRSRSPSRRVGGTLPSFDVNARGYNPFTVTSEEFNT